MLRSFNFKFVINFKFSSENLHRTCLSEDAYLKKNNKND